MLDPIYLFSHEHYSAVFQMHVREARAFVIVYSIHDRQSFDDVPRRWGNVQEARKALVGYGHPEVMDVGWPVMVVAKDYFKGAPVAEREVLERVVSKQEGERIAEELEAKYVEVCSETRDGVDDAFVMLARSIRARIALKVEKGGSRPTGLKSVGRLKQNTETAKNEDESSGCSKRKCVVS
jgi:Ras-related protein R-Ras2